MNFINFFEKLSGTGNVKSILRMLESTTGVWFIISLSLEDLN